jgi:hypothetical protein
MVACGGEKSVMLASPIAIVGLAATDMRTHDVVMPKLVKQTARERGGSTKNNRRVCLRWHCAANQVNTSVSRPEYLQLQRSYYVNRNAKNSILQLHRAA